MRNIESSSILSPMFSRRLNWDFSSNRLSRLLEEKRAAGAEVLDLTESNPTRAGLDYPADEVLAALTDARSLTYDPQPLGLRSAREAVAAHYHRRGVEVSPEDLMLTASTSEAYSFLFKMLGDPGDRILIPRPSYPLFDYLASIESLAADSYSLVYDGCWSIDLETIRRGLSPRTRAILLVHPNNPTGSFVKKTERDALIALCQERKLALIVDEVFADYALEDDPTRWSSFVGESAVSTFVLSGLSKVAALPQMKLAWIWSGGPQGPLQEARQRLEQLGDLFLSVGAPVQHAAARFLDLAPAMQGAIRARLAENLTRLRSALPSPSPLELLRTEGGWYAVLRCSQVRSSEEWALAFLDSDDTLVHPGYLFDFPNEAYLVVSLLTPFGTFAQGIERVSLRVAATLAAI
jgi:aspartate/methionine/tyrosine aminotransferase